MARNLTVTVDDDREPTLDALVAALGVPAERLASSLLRAALASTPAALKVIAGATAPPPKRKTTEPPKQGPEAFDRGWKGYAKAGGRPGSKAAAVRAWDLLLTDTGWTPDDVVRRWALYTKWTEPRFMADAERVLRVERLGDDALEGLVRRARSERGAKDPGLFDEEAHAEVVAARTKPATPAVPQGELWDPAEAAREMERRRRKGGAGE